VFSLESDLLISAGSSTTHTSPRWSPASSGPAAPSLGRVARPCLARGQHTPGRSLPRPAREDHDLSPRMWLVVFRCFWCLRQPSAEEGGPWSWRVFYTSHDGVSRHRYRFWILFFGLFCYFIFLFTVYLYDN
jgi:hypothetical protein